MFPEAPVPRRIGDYHIVRRLRAEGPFEVFLAEEHGPLGFTREVTLRSVRRDPDDPKHSTELAREARICARLNHPGIARVLGFFEEGDRLVLVLEHVDGITLESFLTHAERGDARLPDAASAYIASTVASALAYAHALRDEAGAPSPVLHRALSPEVVHVARDGTVKLGGFSLAKVLDRTPDSTVGLGGAGYTAPERLRSEPATERSDVWALGVLAFRLFGGASAARSVMRVMAGRPPSLSSVREGVPRELVAAVDAALQEDPKKRTIGCAEFARWISRAAPPEEGKRTIRELMERVPEENAGEPAAVERASRRKVRAMQRLAPSAKMAVLHGPRDRELEAPAAPPEEPFTLRPSTPPPPPAPAPAPAPAQPIDPFGMADPFPQAFSQAVQPQPLPPDPDVDSADLEPVASSARLEPVPSSDYPSIEVKGERRTDQGGRAPTMLGLGPVKAPVVISRAEPLPAPSATAASPVSAALSKPALTRSSNVRDPDAIVAALTPLSMREAAEVGPQPVAAPAALDTPPLRPREESEPPPKPRRRRLRNLVLFLVVVAVATAGVEFAMRTRGRSLVPIAQKYYPIARNAVVSAIARLRPKKSETVPTPVTPLPSASGSVSVETAPSTSVSVAPSASESAAPAASESAAPSTSASSKPVPPPGKKLAPDHGWLLVHAPNAVSTRVFVAGHVRGEPGDVLMVPCGKLHVRLAKVDATGKWRGWAAEDTMVSIPCDGTVGEVALAQ